jgi:hypothetical protein
MLFKPRNQCGCLLTQHQTAFCASGWFQGGGSAQNLMTWHTTPQACMRSEPRVAALPPIVTPQPAYQDRLGQRPHEGDACCCALLRKVCTLREEAIAGVDGVHARLLGCADDGVCVEVACNRLHIGGADAVGLVCLVAVRLQAVGRAVDGHLRGWQLAPGGSGGTPHSTAMERYRM